MVDKKVYFLSQVDFLVDLNAQELAELASDFHWEEYAKGSEILCPGGEYRRLYLLTEGKAEALLGKKGQPSLPVSTFKPGDTFGEISLVSGKPSPYIIRCLEDCKVLVLDSVHFAHMLVRWPKLYQRVAEKLSKILNQVNSGLWEAKHKEYLRSALQLTQYEYKFYGVWGNPKTTKEVEARLNELACTKEHLLIVGERGTGRQMIAWSLHRRMFDEGAPFVVVDGRQLDQQWGDSMQVRGANILEIADGGTLLIRDADLISPRSQLNLAKILKLRSSNALVIASIQADTEAKLIPELKECFTQAYKITPLRERKRDIPVIAQGVLEKLAQQHNRITPVLDQEATKLLLSHDYRQGNVTELIRMIERAFFLTEGTVIGLEHVFFGPTAAELGGTFNLLSWAWVEKLIKKSNFVTWLQRSATVVFYLILALLLFLPQTTVATKVFALVWGLWWPALAIISPFLGRVWCTICPFSYVMELIQRKLHFNRPVPEVVRKYDYLIVSFLFLMVFWSENILRIRDHPGSTALLLIIIQTAAVLTGIVYTRHAWCHYLCPLGGFVGVASIGSMVEVRSDATYCLNKCTTYECYKGTPGLSGCPMSQHAPYLDNNLSCKLCFHCVRNCPNNAVKVNVRIPAREVWHLVRINQGYAIFIGTCLGILFPIHYFEQFYQVWPLYKWQLWFSLAYWGTAVASGLISWFLARPFRTKGASRSVKLFFAFIPWVLAGHIIYQLNYVPGAKTLMLGFAFKNPGGLSQPVYTPALLIGQIAATIIGLALTSFSIAMVIRKKDKTRSSKHAAGSNSEAKALHI